MFFTVFVGFLLGTCPVMAVTCRDDAGNSVDWFIAYKFPNSFEYAYLTPASVSWHKSSHEVDQSGMIRNTFDALYSVTGIPDSVYVVYNDEQPNMTAEAIWFGHMKGGFAFDSSDVGFWLIHSVPKFVYHAGSYVYPPTGKMFGQHFLCITLPIAQLNPLINQLLVAKPWIQDSFVSPKVDQDYPNVSLLVNHKIPSSDKYSTQPFSLPQGDLKLIHFSKGAALEEDLYKDLVAQDLGVGLNVETWQHGTASENEPSSCDKPYSSVYNVRQVSFRELGVNFSSWHDHAKWAVSLPEKAEANSAQKWVCLGDLNRQFSQFHRGGGTMCIQSDAIWSAFSSIVSEVEPCSSHWTTSEPVVHQ